MGWLDDVGDAIGGVSDGLGSIFGGEESGLGDWISTGSDWLFSNMDDILKFGGFAVDQYAREEQQESLEDITKKQIEELKTAADVNAGLLNYDADVAEENAISSRNRGDIAYLRNKQKTDEVIATQTARYAKSGVSVDSGTPVDVAMKTAEKGFVEGLMMRNNARVEAEQYMSLAEKKRLAATETLRRAAAQANIAEEAMEDKLTALEYSQWSSGGQFIYQTGVQDQWWV